MPVAWRTLTLRNLIFDGQRFDFLLARDAKGEVHGQRRPPSPAER
jgi:hypothetical protein